MSVETLIMHHGMLGTVWYCFLVLFCKPLYCVGLSFGLWQFRCPQTSGHLGAENGCRCIIMPCVASYFVSACSIFTSPPFTHTLITLFSYVRLPIHSPSSTCRPPLSSDFARAVRGRYFFSTRREAIQPLCIIVKSHVSVTACRASYREWWH